MENQNQFIPPQNIVTPQPSNQPLPPAKKKMKLWKKIIIVLLLLSVLLGIGLYNIPRILNILYPTDSALNDNSDLFLQKVTIPDADNGFFDLEKISSTTLKIPYKEVDGTKLFFTTEYTDFTKTVKWDKKLVEKVLADNEQALDFFNKASSKNYFQVPQFSDPDKVTTDTELPKMNNWRTVSQLQSIKSINLALNGNLDQALQEAVKINKLGHNIILGQNSLIGTLVGVAIKQKGSMTIIQILSKGNPKKQAIADTISSLKNSSEDLTGYKNSFRFEYMIMINGINQLVHNIKSNPNEAKSALEQESEEGKMSKEYASYIKFPYYYKENQTKNLYTSLFSAEVAAVGVTCEINLDPQILPVKNEISNSRMIFIENAFGKFLFTVNGASLSSVIKKQCQTDLLSNIAIIELALKEYKIDHKSLPTTLNDLVPKYLDSIPEDPFDHKPIRYSAEKKILYSVGLNQRDLGGSLGDDWTNMENPTFKIEF